MTSCFKGGKGRPQSESLPASLSARAGGLDNRPRRSYLAGSKSDEFFTPPSACERIIDAAAACGFDRILEPTASHERGGGIVKAFGDRGFSVDTLATLSPLDTDFLSISPDRVISWGIQAIITNPPYSTKNQWLAHCYETGLPFALLLPESAISSKTRYSLYTQHGIDILLLGGRTNFGTPCGREGKDSNPQFEVFWFCFGFNEGLWKTQSQIGKIYG